MSRLFPLSLILLIPIVLSAAPVPSSPQAPHKPLTDAQRAEAEVFAPILVSVSNQIVDLYVHPVARHDLLFAALIGLYERAQRQPPITLYNDCKLALDNASLVKLVLLVRADIGDAENIRGTHPLLICCEAMARFLDPYTGVVSGEEQRRNTGLEQENRGVGLEVGDNPGNGPVVVKMVKSGGPAQRAGLRPGDEITHIDGQAVNAIASERLLEMLNHTPSSGPPSVGAEEQAASPANERVQLKYRRAGEAETRTVTLERTCFRGETVLGVSRKDDNRWNYWVDPKQRIAHLRIATIAKGTASELSEVLDNLQQEDVRGLILDLRWCPGGFLDEAVDCVRPFIGEGVVSTVKMRTKEPLVHRNETPGKFRDVPMVVLVNGDTIGGGELIAAALQDHKRAWVVGQRTFGKASVQTQLHLGLPDMGMKLTTGTFERPNGKNLHRFPESLASDDWGVRPDAGWEFRVSPDMNRQLREWWLQMTLRPGWSRERLALDDAEADAPQQAALQAVLNLLEKQDRLRSAHSEP
jgi:carboxyl-terminal processing protease